MASESQLEKDFEKAVKQVNEHTETFPADFLLRLYAYYKHATGSQGKSPNSREPLINAFKTNALFQMKGLSREEAMEKYIKAANEYFKNLK
ncbi:MAG TPA: acyl-CoA-binding protein [Flavobacteriaceae bacterium]|nr:acyl-CoA-binding protein [Flavobacteriaceae bacterium]